jgi:hypothetical protein
MNFVKIEINGNPLNAGQAMALTAAVASFHETMRDPDALGGDERGRRMATAYRERILEIVQMLGSLDV